MKTLSLAGCDEEEDGGAGTGAFVSFTGVTFGISVFEMMTNAGAGSCGFFTGSEITLMSFESGS